MLRRLCLALGLAVLPFGAVAECQGTNLLETLPGAELSALQARAAEVPFAEGNLWQAEKGGARVVLVGTYHLDDPRLDPMAARLAPVLAQSRRLLVEAGPEEERALKDRIGREPALIVNTDGPTLPESLAPETWARLSQAMRDRGIPPFLAAKFRPWYVSMMLSVPACAMAGMTRPNGLDHRLIRAATDQGLPVQALEPYDTLFRVFGDMTDQDQTAMIEQALAGEEMATDMAVTLADAYFDGQNRLMWEFLKSETARLPGYTPERVETEFAVMDQAMIAGRNQSWIPVIEAAATEGPVLVAFGALHLQGEAGVLNLLSQRGWTVTPLP